MIKPNRGYQGKGIVQVTFLGNEEYELHKSYHKCTLQGRKQTFDHLMSNYCLKKRYIVQQRIPLAVINECLYDIRVMVQRKSTLSSWEVTGKITKVASKRYVVTNYAQKLLPVEDTIENSIVEFPIEETGRWTARDPSGLQEFNGLGTGIGLVLLAVGIVTVVIATSEIILFFGIAAIIIGAILTEIGLGVTGVSFPGLASVCPISGSAPPPPGQTPEPPHPPILNV